MSVWTHGGVAPRIDPTCFVDGSAQVIGDVWIGAESSVWFNSVVRGDVNSIRIGQRTNIQDLSVVHVSSRTFATAIGDDVTVGHRVILHGCQVGDRVLVGMGAILMDGVVVDADSMVAAGSLVAPGTHIPSGTLALGSPARVKRPLTEEERAFLRESASHYARLAQQYRSEKGV